MAEEEYLYQIVSNQKRIYGFIKYVHSYHSEVDDILQETNMTLLKKEHDFDSSQGFLPWAIAIARWTWMAHKQKRRRALDRVTHFPEGVVYEGWDYLIDPATSSSSMQEVDQNFLRREVLNKASQKLLPSEKEILKMSLEGKTLTEMSEELGTSYRATSARKSRLLTKLKKMVRYETSILQES